ncbi:coiled-coil domain-containing protein 13-like [Lycorma delicatula]|uniref:coiled-coil domain-containing protein 13-like n=1 Tax=Lycorma delicatula TaxID=130591 RepID=UPI003F511358
MVSEWLIPQLEEDNNLVFVQDGAQPHWHSLASLEIDIDVTSEMLFPVELNKCLKEKIEVLTEENGRLQRSLEESEAQLKALELKCPPALHGRASDLAASKIVELSKKIRELTAELEVTKLRARNAEYQPIQKKCKEKEQEILLEEKENNSKNESVLAAEVKDLNEKLNSSNLKLCEARNQVQQLKHELKMTQKALTNEVGQNVSVHSILSNKGWRGRAQQICGLQQKLSQLTEKLAKNEQGCSISNESVAAVRQVEKDMRAELNQELKETRKELDLTKNKLSAVKARCRVLENDLTVSKEKITTLLEKTCHDDQLITALTDQINSVTEKHKEEQLGIIKKMEQNMINLENNLACEKTRNNQLQVILEGREEQINELQEKLKIMVKQIAQSQNQLLEQLPKERVTISRPFQSTGVDYAGPILIRHCKWHTLSTNPATVKAYIALFDVLGQVAEAERVRLLELIQVLNKRLNTARVNSLQTEEELCLERQKSAKLETKVARLELERVGAERTPATYAASLNRSNVTEISVNEKAKEKIELLEEKCAALKVRLHSLSEEKEDDLYHMTCLLDEAKKSYMEALRKNSS